MSQLQKILGSKYPILQGPIRDLNDPNMVAAVSEAGGFGVLALGAIRDPERIRIMVREVKARTDKPFGANLMIAINPNNEAILEMLAEEGVRTVTTSAGSPKKIYPKIRELGMKGLHVALTAPLAAKAADAGADGVIVSGAESGGLRTSGSESTNMVLVPLVCDMVDIPVVAAGGIADSRGYRAALALGAQGVQVGTAFLASKESPAKMEWKDAILACGDGGTALVPRGPVASRMIMNPETSGEINGGDDPEADYGQNGRNWGAGQVSALIRKIRPIREIVEEMVS